MVIDHMGNPNSGESPLEAAAGAVGVIGVGDLLAEEFEAPGDVLGHRMTTLSNGWALNLGYSAPALPDRVRDL